MGKRGGAQVAKIPPHAQAPSTAPPLFLPLLNLAPASEGGASRGCGGQRPVPFLSLDDTMLHPLPSSFQTSPNSSPSTTVSKPLPTCLQPFPHLRPQSLLRPLHLSVLTSTVGRKEPNQTSKSQKRQIFIFAKTPNGSLSEDA